MCCRFFRCYQHRLDQSDSGRVAGTVHTALMFCSIPDIANGYHRDYLMVYISIAAWIPPGQGQKPPVVGMTSPCPLDDLHGTQGIPLVSSATCGADTSTMLSEHLRVSWGAINQKG